MTPNWLSKLKSLFGITKWQTKVGTGGIITTLVTVPGLTFNNLEIGKTYRVMARLQALTSSGVAYALSGEYRCGGATVDYWQDMGTCSTGNARMIRDVFVFTATATTFSVVVLGITGANIGLVPLGSIVTMEELPNHVTTTQLT